MCIITILFNHGVQKIISELTTLRWVGSSSVSQEQEAEATLCTSSLKLDRLEKKSYLHFFFIPAVQFWCSLFPQIPVLD